MEYRDIDDSLLLSVCQDFLDGKSVKEILERFNARATEPIKRENVYPMLREARKRGYFDVHPPANHTLQQRIIDSFRLEKGRVTVLRARGMDAIDPVAEETARVILRLIHQVGANQRRVHIGLGGGTSVMRVARKLAALLSREASIPDLSLHALTSGFDVNKPQTAPVMFFGFFDQLPANIKYVGLFAQAVVKRQAQYNLVMKDPGVLESFRRANDIDIVVTSLASAQDPDGELTDFLKVGQAGKVVAALNKRGWVGDVLYRPYNTTEAITIDSAARAVSIFELEGLVRLAAKPNKHVVLIGAPCNRCGRPKGDALQPLFREKKLRLWSHIVMDMEAARILLDG
jgi:DNA-binding transcriptional regulator LsrR (DeoR family)